MGTVGQKGGRECAQPQRLQGMSLGKGPKPPRKLWGLEE